MTEYATVAQAARRLGISRSAVHRRLKSGELSGRQEPRPQGLEPYVRRIEEQAEELGQVRAELAAAKAETAKATATNGQAQQSAAPESSERRPWWRRLFG